MGSLESIRNFCHLAYALDAPAGQEEIFFHAARVWLLSDQNGIFFFNLFEALSCVNQDQTETIEAPLKRSVVEQSVWPFIKLNAT